jgi:hypothetical protein
MTLVFRKGNGMVEEKTKFWKLGDEEKHGLSQEGIFKGF